MSPFVSGLESSSFGVGLSTRGVDPIGEGTKYKCVGPHVLFSS